MHCDVGDTSAATEQSIAKVLNQALGSAPVIWLIRYRRHFLASFICRRRMMQRRRIILYLKLLNSLSFKGIYKKCTFCKWGCTPNTLYSDKDPEICPNLDPGSNVN